MKNSRRTHPHTHIYAHLKFTVLLAFLTHQLLTFLQEPLGKKHFMLWKSQLIDLFCEIAVNYWHGEVKSTWPHNAINSLGVQVLSVSYCLSVSIISTLRKNQCTNEKMQRQPEAVFRCWAALKPQLSLKNIWTQNVISFSISLCRFESLHTNAPHSHSIIHRRQKVYSQHYWQWMLVFSFSLSVCPSRWIKQQDHLKRKLHLHLHLLVGQSLHV